MPAPNEYVAMGSSFAAGPGISPRVADSPRAAGRSARNYAHLVAERLGLALTDVTFSGATTSDILSGHERGTPPQIDAVTSATRLVTVTGGGNDVGYLPVLTLSSLPRVLSIIPGIRRRIVETRDASTGPAKFDDLEVNLAAIIRKVHARSPQCLVVLVDYLTILPPTEATPTGPLPTETAVWGRGIAARLNAVTSAAAGVDGALFVDAAAASAAHHAWSPVPWTMRFHLSLRGGAPYHPNAAGMAAVADLVSKAVGPSLTL
jgi:lysophospholipase L1-like esterase